MGGRAEAIGGETADRAGVVEQCGETGDVVQTQAGMVGREACEHGLQVGQNSEGGARVERRPVLFDRQLADGQ